MNRELRRDNLAVVPVTLPCPICRRSVAFDDPNMPFCSDRCRLIDLGNWSAESYRVPAEEDGPDLKDLPPESPPSGYIQ